MLTDAAVASISAGDQRLHSALASAVLTAKQLSAGSYSPASYHLPSPPQGPLPFAAGYPVSSGDVVTCFSYVFEEYQTLEATNWHRTPALQRYSFEERCLASGCPQFLPRFVADESSPLFGQPQWDGPPLKRICLGRSALKGGLVGTPRSQGPLHPAWRFPILLGIESGIRTQLCSVAGSRRGSRSGISAWNVFVSSEFPMEDSLAPTLPQLLAYGAMFSNGDTLGKYLGSLKLALRLVGRLGLPAESVISGLLRGARKHRVLQDRPALRSKQVLALVYACTDSRDIELARLLIIGRQFLLRVADELFPLQRQRHLGLSSDSRSRTSWPGLHSSADSQE